MPNSRHEHKYSCDSAAETVVEKPVWFCKVRFTASKHSLNMRLWLRSTESSESSDLEESPELEQALELEESSAWCQSRSEESVRRKR